MVKTTLLDVSRRLDPTGKVATIVEQLVQTNEILLDMPFVEGNLPTGHVTTVRSGLPAATWRKLNYGVQPSKSTTRQISDTCGRLEAYAEIDKVLAELNGNEAAFRLSEDKAFLEGMNQAMATTIFYGDTDVNKERFVGLSPRFSSLSAESGANIISGAGTASNALSSIWLVCWGPNTVHGIYPKGTEAGFKHTDLGEQTLIDAAGGLYQGYRSHYTWNSGLTVRDWRYIVRIANIDSAALLKNAATGADLIDLMTQALELVQDLNLGTPVFYCNRKIKGFLRRQIVNKVASSTLSIGDVAGKPTMMLGEVPVRRCDQLVNTEAQVT